MAIAAAAGFAMSGCSPGADYPSLFPAVHDMPPPRADKPMDAEQVQQATESLITERNQLSSEAQANSQPASPAKKPVSATAKKPPAAAGQNAGAPPPATAASTQTAGADTKP